MFVLRLMFMILIAYVVIWLYHQIFHTKESRQEEIERLRQRGNEIQKRQREIEEETKVGYHYLMARHREYRDLENEFDVIFARLTILIT